VAVLFAREGADVPIGHLAEEDTDANETVKLVEAEGGRCLTLPGDVGDEAFCREAVERTVRELGRLDVLVNNAAEQHTTQSIAEISAEQLERTFRTNIFAMFFLTKAALPTWARARRSSTPPRSPPTRATRACSTTPRPKAPSSPSPAACPSSWSATGSGATPSPRGRSGRR
jgi:NAD(P)-dependent dehydrogenase (short-subunit alcohol dehydrogenase family)